MKNLGMTVELHPKGDKITCPAFGWYSSPAEYSTMGHFVLDLTSLSCQSRERSAHPKRHVTFALLENRHLQLTHVNLTNMMMTNLSFAQMALPFLKMKTISLWCNLHQEKKR